MSRPCQRCGHLNEGHAKFCLSCGAMLEIAAEGSDADPLLGKVIQGRYRPTRLLGEGGMGRVYVAEQKMGAATRKVAIKTLHPELSQDPQLVARFNRECETVIELSHPNTIQFFDFGTLDDGTLFIVMEYIEGRALAADLERGAIEPGRVDKILVQVCGSLHEAHGRGIVHRDLKPDNILLTDRGGQADFVKVLDFGIAKKGEAEDPQKAKLTKQGMVLGTPPYMSPEQFSGKALDARSDIYSLAIMAFEMLTGKLPFEAATPWEWATKHLTAQPAPFEAFPSGMHVAPNKRAAILRALAKAPEQRHGTVLEFLQEFTGHQDAAAAWTMATSGGQIVPKNPAAPAFQAGTPAPTGPFGGTSPAPGYGGSMPGSVAPGSLPGSAPMGPAGMMAGTAQMPSVPYGQPPVGTPIGTSPGFAPGASAPSGGSGVGRFVLVGVLVLFMVVGALAGTALFFAYGNANRTDPPPVANGPTEPTTPTVAMVPIATTPTPTGAGTPPLGTLPGGGTPSEPVATPRGAPDAGTLVATGPSTGPATGGGDRDDDGERSGGPARPRVSPADEARARSLNAGGLAALGRRDYRNAVASLDEANGLVGRRSALTAELRRELAARGGREVGAYLMGGNCPGAQALYRDLSRVGAGSSARGAFTEWCPLPR